MEGLQETWRKLKLSEEEDKVVGIGIHDDELTKQRTKLLVAAKLITDNPFCAAAMKNTMTNVWKPDHGMGMREAGSNHFIFQFFHHDDKNKVLKGCPWHFDDNLLLLKDMEGYEKPSEIPFTHSPFWILVYDVPFNKRNINMAKAIGNHVGTFLEYDVSDVLGLERTMRIKVLVDVTKPLLRGVKIAVGESWKWVDIKYERLPIFCYTCGVIGHREKSFPRINEEGNMMIMPNQYGSWLRASLTSKSKMKVSKSEMENEQRWLNNMKERQKREAAKVPCFGARRLEFNEGVGGGGGVGVGVGDSNIDGGGSIGDEWEMQVELIEDEYPKRKG